MRSSFTPLALAAWLSVSWVAGTGSIAAAQDAPAPAPAAPQKSPESDDAPAGEAKAKHEGPRLEFGRAAVKVFNIEQGNAHTVIVRAESVGSAATHVSRVTIRGEGVTAMLVRKKVGKPIESGKPLDPAVEIAPGAAARFDILLDPAGLKVGDHAAVLEIETDGNDGKPLVLPIDWEIVEPQVEEKDAKEEKPLPRRNDVLKELHTKGPPPRFDVDPQRFDFGHVLKGERVKTSFKITNKGEGDLIFQKIQKQCHCTLPHLFLPDGVVPKKTLQQEEMLGTLKPGQEATLEVEIDTAGMGGHGHKIVQVFTNDLANSPFPISLELDIDNPFDFSPQSVFFDGVRHGNGEVRVVRMSSTAEVGPFAINGYELPQPPAFDVEYRKANKLRKNEVCAWEITLTVRDDTPCGDVSGKLKLDLEHARIRGIDLNYRVRVLPDVDWIDGTNHSPETIQMGLVRPGLNDTRSIFLENKNPSVPYAPTSVTIESNRDVSPFKAELVPIEAGKRYEIKFSVVSAPPGRGFSGELVIHSDHPLMKELRLKFSGIWNASAKGSPH